MTQKRPFQTATEAAAKWGVNPATVRAWCREGKIKDAQLFGDVWTIPADAKPYEYRNRPRAAAQEAKP